MSAIINKIQLNNWFNYKGSYDQNQFKFSDGLNIVVGENNAGKTKLHNAFRWILKDEVILEIDDKLGPENVDAQTIMSIINQSTFRETKLKERINIGVKLEFTETKRDSSRTYILTKEISCRKDVDSVDILNEITKIQVVDPVTKSPRSYNEDWDKITTRIISNRFLDYFFIEGEQLGLMTPLQGPKLKNTINSIVHIETLDNLVTKADYLSDKVSAQSNEIELEEGNISQERQENIEEIKELKGANKELKKSIDHNEAIKVRNDKLISRFKKRAKDSKRNQALVQEYDELSKNVEIAETLKESAVLDYIGGYMNESIFGVGRLSNDKIIEEKIAKQQSQIKTWIAERRTELKTDLSDKEQKMILALEKSQPKPEILELMIEVGDCFICNNKLSPTSIDYMRNKLIPFFRDELEDDNELMKLQEVNELLNNLSLDSSIYFAEDKDALRLLNDKIIDKTTKQRECEEKIAEFIEANGEVKADEADEVNLNTFAEAIRLMEEAENQILRLTEDIEKNKKSITDLENKNKGETGTESDKLKRIKKLLSFSENIAQFLSGFKKSEYEDFAKNLEKKATKRFQSFMRNNETSKGQKIQVVKNEDHNGDFEFKICVVNQYDEKQEQPGGADQALRRVAVVFGLLDIAENKNGYPFIADAPISKLSTDTKKAFFESLLADEALTQSIILNMDLWSGDKKDLNVLGNQVFKMIQGIDKSSLMVIRPKPGNKGVEIEYKTN